MALARMIGTERELIEADFQQFYGLDLERMTVDYTVAHAARLAVALPVESRCAREVEADLAWSVEAHMLSRVEHELRCLLWGMADKASRGPYPKPIEPPSKAREMRRRMDGTDTDMIDEAIFGGRHPDGR